MANPLAPPLAKSPEELLTIERPIEESLVSKYGFPFGGALLGFVATFGANYMSGRPYHAGLHRYIFLVGGLAALAKFGDDYRTRDHAEKDAVLLHYVRLHPEDFPPFERVKIGDIFDRWYPIR